VQLQHVSLSLSLPDPAPAQADESARQAVVDVADTDSDAARRVRGGNCM
jgi:hypothetical protein